MYKGGLYMANAITTPEENYRLNPEALEFVQVYMANFSLEETMDALDISREDAVYMLKQKEVQRFLDTVFYEQGYMNRFKLMKVLDKVVESKLEEAEESEVYSGKDLIEILKLIHTIQMDNRKADKDNVPGKQNNVQINSYGENLGTLMERIINGEG